MKEIKHYEFPIYSQVTPDLLLIGVIHSDVKKRSASYVRNFIKRITPLDHLAFEATGEFHEFSREMDVKSLERFAYEEFRGQKHFLDEGVDHPNLLNEMGISGHLYAILYAMRCCQGLLKSCHGPSDFFEKFEAILVAERQFRADLKQVSAKKVVEILERLFQNLSHTVEKMDDCFFAAFAFGEYMVRFRDHKIYYPKLKKLINEMRGKKGAVLGRAHIDSIVGLIKEGEGSGYPTWNDYTRTLDERLQSGLHLIEIAVDQAKNTEE